jgi:hypothetical protein
VQLRVSAIQESIRLIAKASRESDEDRPDCRDSLATLNEQLKAIQGLRGFMILD